MLITDILQPTHLLLILVVALLVLGPKRLPEVGRSVGRTLHDFKSATSGEATPPPDQVVSAEVATPSGPGTDPAA